MKRALSLAAICGGLAFASPTAACSFSWQKGWSPEEIKQRDDLRSVKGRFVLEDSSLSRSNDGLYTLGTITGRLETQRGTGWSTWQDYSEISVDCGAYRKPLADAEGTFWISRKRKDGRYQIYLWEGEYLPVKDTANPDDANEIESDAN